MFPVDFLPTFLTLFEGWTFTDCHPQHGEHCLIIEGAGYMVEPSLLVLQTRLKVCHQIFSWPTWCTFEPSLGEHPSKVGNSSGVIPFS